MVNSALVFLTAVETLVPVPRIAIKNIDQKILFWALKTRNDSNYKSYCCPCLVAKDVATHIGDNGTAWCLMYLMGCICTGWVSPVKLYYETAVECYRYPGKVLGMGWGWIPETPPNLTFSIFWNTQKYLDFNSTGQLKCLQKSGPLSTFVECIVEGSLIRL